MNGSGAPWHFSNVKEQSKIFAVTKEQVEKQLAAVTELRNFNGRYLETFERAWIDHIIDTAVAVVVDSTYQEVYSPQPEKTSRNPARLREKLTTRRLRANGKEQLPPRGQLEVLLSSAKSLNSALSLLSCCHDRWIWVKSSKSSDVGFSPTANDLQELLNWKRQSNEHLKNSPNPDKSFQEQESAADSLHDRESDPPRLSTDICEDSESQLSILVETVEKWRYDAEAALDTTTRRYQGRTLSSLQRPERRMTPSISPAVTDAIPVQMTRPGRPVVVSKPDSKPYSLDCSERYQAYNPSNPTIDVSNYDPPYGNFTVPRRPLSQRHAHHMCDLSDHQVIVSSSGTPQFPSSLIPGLTHQPFIRSLQNSFDKESIPPGALQTPGPQISLHTSSDTIQDVSRHSSDRQPISDDSLSESDEICSQKKTPDDRTKSVISSASNTSASASGSSPQLTSDTASSPQSKSSDGKIVSRSRGRMLLEQHEELEWRKPPLPERPPMMKVASPAIK